ncbi:NADH dehydrogenase subunit 4 (mitochondrion) [Neolecta irregularis DAH-3]|uniref:NADH-ubiquinone oxidoreductase chain 4 n=1 Tax=Neolecta irregularis (strain DAH-3) TaxID=1198029 RepID=A0A1U7LG23_NEOID|nr:NADH dehydrogenase subunit 4 [Neolecta irregularis DAH-3]|eukprot:OLL21606.1 NADH dehydrogenase subunit 4 (mitochondrion) [Neolecta irregularis DAH-3]
MPNGSFENSLPWNLGLNIYGTGFGTGICLPHITNVWVASLGVDGISIYFILLTTFIMPITILSSWSSIKNHIVTFLVIILLLESLLIIVFSCLDILLFYIFFESTLPPLFLLIGIFGSSNKVRASYYLFLYTLFGSLFLLLAILTMYFLSGSTDFTVLFQTKFNFELQKILWLAIFFAFAI